MLTLFDKSKGEEGEQREERGEVDKREEGEKGEEGEEESAMHQVIVYIWPDQGKGRKSIAFFPSANVCLTADDTSVTSWLHPRVYMIGGNICAVWPLAHCTQLEATRKTEDFCATVLFWVL